MLSLLLLLILFLCVRVSSYIFLVVIFFCLVPCNHNGIFVSVSDAVVATLVVAVVTVTAMFTLTSTT